MSLATDVANYIDSNTSLTLGTDLFISRLPGSPTTCVVVYETGGMQPDGDAPTQLKEPTFQILIRSSDYATGRAYLDTMRSLFHKLIETDVGGTHFLNCFLVSEGGHIGQDDAGNDEFSINFVALIR